MGIGDWGLGAKVNSYHKFSLVSKLILWFSLSIGKTRESEGKVILFIRLKSDVEIILYCLIN